MEVDPVFPRRREIKRKKHFDEVQNDVSNRASLSREESFRVSYFLYVVDQAISSLSRRFEQYENFESIFGFLFSSKKLYSLDDTCLKSSCIHIEGVLKNNEQCDIDERSFSKLKLLKSYLRSTMTQERLNGLAMVAIEKNLLEDTKIE
ncbi:hypothetical protein LINPERPRIM_LOCUS24546, partial [Linum perenne]